MTYRLRFVAEKLLKEVRVCTLVLAQKPALEPIKKNSWPDIGIVIVMYMRKVSFHATDI